MTTPANVAPSEKDVFKVGVVAAAAASIEWYDFFIYGTAAALVFPAVFFPEQTPLIGALLSFATFGVGFLARPVGGIVFGHFGDLVGRKRTLIVALVAMGIASTLIGLLPSYAVLGAAAPIVLVVLRFVQGVAVGGQQGGVILLAIEGAPRRRRGFYGSFASIGAPGGIILANLAFLIIAAIVSPEAFQAWGWRIPFLVSLALIGLAVYIQLRLEDTPAFQRLQAARQRAAHSTRTDESPTDESPTDESPTDEPRSVEVRPKRSPVLEAFRTHPRQVLLATGAYIAVNMTYYIFVAYVISYATSDSALGMPNSTILTAVLIASVVQFFALPAAGLLSDRFGRRILYLIGAATLGVWSFVFWPLVDTKSFALILVALIVGLALLHSLMYGPQAAFFGESFTTGVRYSGVSLGIQLGSVLGGAFAPLIATALLAALGTSFSIAAYMAVMCAITFVAVLFLKETRTVNLDDPQQEPAKQ